MRYLTKSAMLILTLLLCSCAGQKRYLVHHTLLEDPGTQPTDVKIIPSNIKVYEITAGGVVEEVGDWSTSAEKNICSAVIACSDDGVRFELLDTTLLSSDERKILDQHLALFDIVAGSVLWATNPQMHGPWAEKRTHFDYTIGDGLSFLKTKYGYDAGFIVMGRDYISTSGRKAFMVAAMVVGVSIPMGHTFIVAGLVDFETGNILWFDHAFDPGSTDMRDPESTQEFVNYIMNDFQSFIARDDPNAK